MKIKKIEKIKFEDAIEYFNFTQFYEICKIFGIDVVDREVYNQLAAEARENGNSIDISKIKMRRDFAKMGEELIAYYNSLSRRNRRQIDPIIAKIVWGNKRAAKIANDKIAEQHAIGTQNLDNVVEELKKQNEVLVEDSTDSAAVATESDN